MSDIQSATGSQNGPKDLSEALLALGVDPRAIERGRRVSEEGGQHLGTVLLQLGLANERDIATAYAAVLHTVVAGPGRYPAEGPLPFADRLAPRFLRAARALPLAVENGALVVAMADPQDSFTKAAIEAATGLPVIVEVAVPIELEVALARLVAEPTSQAAEGAEPDSGDDEDAERLKDMASEAPVIRLVNQIIARAVESGASDIHIEPFENRLRVRYRYDGVLHETESPPARLAAAITSRIKIMARLDIAERRLPQDGRIKLPVRGQDVDFRISTVASLHGETVVLRVLDRSSVTFEPEKLGLSAPVARRFNDALRLPNGIVLVTGPTGSGKTTTLYTGLLSLNSVERKVVTVEDPVEYQLAGINQIQVKPQIGLTFASLLRSILRQDPDVIMVGEIRDLETAQIAVQAALTGHLVLSTLHTNSAAASITRLRDMGLEDYLITAVLRGVLAQRLVRKLCTDCRTSAPAAPELIRSLGVDHVARGQPVTLWHAVGCPSCRGTGYRGRQAIAEFLAPDSEIERLVFSRANHTEIERAAVQGGMTTMFRAGVAAALAGITTIEEVMRSIRAEQDDDVAVRLVPVSGAA